MWIDEDLDEGDDLEEQHDLGGEGRGEVGPC
jgi:hypothetical protein